MSSFEVDYEEDLIPRIRDLIDGYDKDSILKEYLQNADDSGATELIVTFDKQKYSKLDGTEFEPANNYSLLIYNNSQFKEKDFKSIVKISAQGKSDDANSTGRFGQGFSSSFSISDHPSFVSNKRVYWFDVQRTAVSKDKSKSIQGWDYTNPVEIKEWLNTFNIAGFSKDFKGTIFRLPLRNEQTSIESSISNEIFTFDDFLKWVEEWKNSSENLLFLRHIHKLVLQEVDENGNKITHLEISTKNNKEIESYNNQIQKEFVNKNLIQICKDWESTDKKLPLFIYKHYFEIKYGGQIEHKIYAVVNGLVKGENNSLIERAKKVLNITPNPRKVLPWVGVAVEVNDRNEPIKNESKLFTFLPLPIKSNYSIYMHGWFDLNPKRTEITNSGSGYDKETLVEWNKLLLEEGISKSWALLIDDLKIDKNSHYNFWAKDTEFTLNEELIKGFYKSISELNCLYTIYKEKESWLSPKEKNLFYFKDEKNQILLDAFKEHFPIIYPKPQKFIIENFKKVGVELIEITPEFIRDYLQEESKDIDFPVNIEKIPITMLQKKEWLIEIIKYCADNEEDYNLLNGLPVKLTLDKNIYKVGSDTLFDKSPNLKLFQDMKYLYINTNIVNLIDNIDTLPNSWLHSTLENQIKLLSKTDYWENITITKEWLEEIVNVITNSTQEEFNEAEDIIKELQLVYQENNEYGKLESKIDEYSPFMPRDEDIENNLIYLDEISMNVVHHEYAEIYKPFLKYEGLITELTSKTLIQHLLLLYSFEDSFDFFKKKDTREYLVDILTENITWFDDLSDSHKLTLYAMPFIETVADNIYAKTDDKKLFLPTNFTPPKHIKSLEGEYEVVAVERNSNLYELYLKMGLTEQNINSYIQEIIIPFLEKSDNYEDKKEVLKWLSDEWGNIKKDDIDKEILDELKDSSIIPTLLDEQKLYKASELYLPTIDLGEIFNDGLYMPISFSDDKKIQEKWVKLLNDLGSTNDILPQHIISKVEKIIEEENKYLAIDLLNFIANKFELFEEMKFEDTSILEVLKGYAWFPVEEPKDILKPKNEYSPLKKPDELILRKYLKIAGGYYHILDNRVKLGKKDEKGEYNEKDMAEKLGIVTNIPNESFLRSFRELIKLSPINGKVVNYTKEVYKYIGRRFKGENIDFDIDERMILIDNQWIAPKYVYQYKINLTGIKSWEKLVGNEIESNLAKGLILLGVQEKPTFEFFIEQLQELPQEQELNLNKLRDAKALLNEIQNKDENFIYDELPILTPYNQLVTSSKLYINDFPAYKNAKEKNEDLNFCQNQFDRLAKRLNVLSLNENHTSKIYKYQEIVTNNKIINMLEKESFKEGILRLLYHERKIQEDGINESLLNEVLPSKIIFVNQLIIEYVIKHKFLFKSDETTYEDDGELYILEQDDEDDMIEVIAKYICDTKNLSRDSFGWIERILRNKMSREVIEEFLDKKKVIELPQKFDIDDESNLYDNTNISESKDETIYDTSTSQEENYPQENAKEKEEIDSSVKAKTLSENKEKVSSSQIDNEVKEEIPPPTQPKTSSEAQRVDIESDSNTNRKINSSNSFEGNSSTKSNRKIVSSNDRKPVYVGKDREVDKKQQKSQRDSAKEIGDKGEAYVLDNKSSLLLSSKNYFQKAPINNKGFDLYEKDQSGQTIRYIEVKTLTGRWGEGGVGITEHQLDFAQKQKDKWWLFVVENINTDNTKVYQFKNPVLEANRFMFDSSWKQLAYQKDDEVNFEPKVGDKYEIEIEGIMKTCIVTDIKPRGALYQVDLILEDGKEIKKKKFKKSWRKIDG